MYVFLPCCISTELSCLKCSMMGSSNPFFSPPRCSPLPPHSPPGGLSQGPVFALDVSVNITVITERGHEFLMNSQAAELANLLFFSAFSPLFIGCASDSTRTKRSGNVGFEKSFLSALLTVVCHRVKFYVFSPVPAPQDTSVLYLLRITLPSALKQRSPSKFVTNLFF